MEYNDLMKQAEDFNKKLHRTKDINVADILTWEDRDAIANIVDKRVAKIVKSAKGFMTVC